MPNISRVQTKIPKHCWLYWMAHTKHTAGFVTVPLISFRLLQQALAKPPECSSDVLHYIHSTIDYGFTFASSKQVPLHTFMSYPHSSDTKVYHDAIPPEKDRHHCLTTYSEACWGSQLGNAVQEGVQLPLFKFRSISGAIIFCSGGPITWKGERQEQTALSLCDAEICATNMGSRLTVNTRNMISHLSSIVSPSKTPMLPGHCLTIMKHASSGVTT
jgi:hypothetical protein